MKRLKMAGCRRAQNTDCTRELFGGYLEAFISMWGNIEKKINVNRKGEGEWSKFSPSRVKSVLEDRAGGLNRTVP